MNNNYTPVNWKDELGTGLTKYRDENTQQEFDMTHIPDSITQIGTPVNADNLNHMEQGIVDHDNILSNTNITDLSYEVVDEW